MFEKPWFQKLNKIADWIIRIVVVNIFVILLSIPIITFFIGIKVAYRLFSDYVRGKETPLFSTIWNTLKEDFFKDLAYSAVSIILIALGLASAYWYSSSLQDNQILYYLGLIVTLGFSVSLFILSLYFIVVKTNNKNIEFRDSRKLATYLAGKYFLRTFVILLSFIIPLVLFLFSVLNPKLFAIVGPLYVFSGLSAAVIVLAVLARTMEMPQIKDEEDV